MTASRLKLKFCGVDSENESWNLQRAQIIWAAVPISRGARAKSGPVCTEERGEERKRGTSEDFPQNAFFKRSLPNHGSKSNPCRENKRWYLTCEQRRKERVLFLNDRHGGERLQQFPPIHTVKGLDFLLSDILALTYEMLHIDLDVGSCVWPEIGNHSRKLDKIQEWRIGFSQNTFPLVLQCDLCGFVPLVLLSVFSIRKGNMPNDQKDLLSKVLSHKAYFHSLVLPVRQCLLPPNRNTIPVLCLFCSI